LTAGITYGFKIEARNVVGYSAHSSELRLVAAQQPVTPSTPSTTIDEVANTITIIWVAPGDNGSVITGYRVVIR
jgi:hypothetical protein